RPSARSPSGRSPSARASPRPCSPPRSSRCSRCRWRCGGFATVAERPPQPARASGPTSSAGIGWTCQGGGMTPLAEQIHTELTRDQRIGQLFMVATPADGVSAVFRSVVLDQHVGNAVLTGHSTKGADHVRSVTMDVQELTESRDTTGGIPAFIAAEPTSGPLRVPYHAGCSEIPSPHGEGPVETE